MEPIDDETYGGLAKYFTNQQIIDICLTVGLSNMVNRFHATFQTDLDSATSEEATPRKAFRMNMPLATILARADEVIE